MSTYTPDEIQAAVEKLIRGSIRRPLDSLGTRRNDITFSDVQEAAAGMFILYPLSPFYAVFLGSRRLKDQTLGVATLVSELRGMVGAVGRRVLPIEEVENLFNAKAALESLEGAVENSAPKDITKLPAFQRFASNVSTFLLTHGSKIKEKGQIVPTPVEARRAIPGLVRQLTKAHDDLISVVTTIAGAVDDYNGLNLPSIVARGVVSKAREVLGAHADELEALSPEDRLANVRDVVLDLLAAKAVVQRFGSFAGVSSFFAMSGTGAAYADASHPSTPAALVSTNAAPYAVVTGLYDKLAILMDQPLGPLGFEYLLADTVTLNPSLVAVMNALRPEAPDGIGNYGYVITAATNDSMKLKFTDITGSSTTITFALTPNALPRTAQQICDDINAGLLANALNTKWLAEPYFLPATFFGTLNVTGSAGATATFSIPVAGDMSFVELTNIIDIKTGPNAGLWDVTVLNSPTSITAVKRVGVATNQAGVDVFIGRAQRAIRIRAIDLLAQVPLEATIAIVTDTDINRAAVQIIGYGGFSSAFCRPTTAQMLADDIRQKLASKLDATAIVQGTTTPVRTVPGTNMQLIASKKRTTGQVNYTPGVPNSIAVTNVTGLLAAGVVVGDKIVLRGGTPANSEWTITALTDTTATATSTDVAVNGVLVTMDFGPPLALLRWYAVDVPSGILEGRYYISGPGPTSLDLLLINNVPATQDPLTHEALTGHGTVGQEYVRIASRKTTTLSSVAIDPSTNAEPMLFTVPPVITYGTSPWFQLPVAAVGLDREDLLEVHATDYNNPSVAYDITGVSGRILGIAPEMPSNQAWTFNDVPPPFARLKHGHTVNFGLFKAALDVWLARSINTTTYYRDLSRYLNPLLHNSNPTAEQVGTALSHLEMLLDYLIVWEETMVSPALALESILSSYMVSPVAPVDTLIRSYKEKGADRATDLLLQGQFSTFFNMDVHDVSYAGTMQKSMRSVMQEDLPIRSTKRQDVNRSRLISSSPSPDYEYDQSDVERGTFAPDPPGDVG